MVESAGQGPQAVPQTQEGEETGGMPGPGEDGVYSFEEFKVAAAYQAELVGREPPSDEALRVIFQAANATGPDGKVQTDQIGDENATLNDEEFATAIGLLGATSEHPSEDIEAMPIDQVAEIAQIGRGQLVGDGGEPKPATDAEPVDAGSTGGDGDMVEEDSAGTAV